jgi:hypothetical protein
MEKFITYRFLYIIITPPIQGMKIAFILSEKKVTGYFMTKLFTKNLSIHYGQKDEIYPIPHFPII